jgi:alkaline phosphatase D
VILWTRVTPPPEAARSIPVRWRVARDPELRDVVASGRGVAGPIRDYTVKVDATGLDPGTSWYYSFSALGIDSPVGRTRTLPEGRTDRVRLAFASCANLPFGWFHAYALIARRDDLDAVLHLGDYLYEYANGTFGDGTEIGRIPAPDSELLTLEDYRTRHAQYKSDPDLQALHARHPVIAVWDDHELANNAWRGGAQNHQENEGPWEARRRSALRAYLEWMPMREGLSDGSGRPWREFRFGDLVDLLMLETRLDRDPPVDDPADARALEDPLRRMLGVEEEAWLLERLDASVRDGLAWRVIGQQTMMGQLRDPNGLIDNPDQWDGYPVARQRIFDHIGSHGIRDVVVLTGDLHSAWALELAADPFARGRYDPATGRGALAVEFVTPGVTSPSPIAAAKADATTREVLERHPHVKWVDFAHQGYALLDVDRQRAQCEWYFVSDVRKRRASERLGRVWLTRAGASHLEAVAHASAPRPPRLPAPVPAAQPWR